MGVHTIQTLLGRSPLLWDLGILCAIVAITALVFFARIRLLRSLAVHVEKQDSVLRAAALETLKTPTGALILLLGFLSVLTAVQLRFVHISLGFTMSVGTVTSIVKSVGFTVIGAWFLINLTAVLEKYCLQKMDVRVLDPNTIGLLIRILRLVVLIVALLVGLQALGVPLSGILAFGGASTLVIGFASKDLLANCFGAMTVYLDRPFNVGDWVSSPDKNIEGVVEHIGWRLTRIRRFNKHPLYVPNSLFSTIVLENPSRMTSRQIKDTLAFRYQDANKLPGLIKDVQTMLDEHPDLDHQCTTFIVFNQFTTHSLNCLLYCFTKTTDWRTYLQVQQDLFLKILALVQEHGCEVAFPTQNLNISDNALQDISK